MLLTSEQRQRNEASIRAAMDRLLRGDLPAGGHCDLKRSPAKPESPAPGSTPAPRTGRTTETSELRRRVKDRDNTITELLAVKTRALSQLAAQYDEITQLRQAATQHQTPPTRPAADVIALVSRR